MSLGSPKSEIQFKILPILKLTSYDVLKEIVEQFYNFILFGKTALFSFLGSNYF